MSDVMQMPGFITMREFVQMDDGERGQRWWRTEKILNDPSLRRRLVRTQIEELLALYRHYPLPEFESIRQILTTQQQAYNDVEPFDHSLLAAMDE